MNINKEDILPFNFFTYKKPFYGSVKGMRYCMKLSLIQEPNPEAEGETIEKKVLLGTIWRGPYALEATKEEIVEKQFSFDPAGREECIEWLEENYCAKPEFWEYGITLFPPRRD